MLSDLSLGELSISEISVLELPILFSDLWDPEPFRVASTIAGAQKSSHRRKWSSKGRIHNAIASGNEYVVRALLALGSDIEERDRDGKTPLAHAVLRNREAIVKPLLQKGADFEVLTALGPTINLEGRLHSAIESGSENVVRSLLAMGADVEERDGEGKTPLAHAVLGNREAIVKLLLEKGADFQVLTQLRSTINVKGRLHSAIESGNENVVRWLLELGADLEERMSFGNFNMTPLLFAAYKGKLAIVKLLLEKGADVNARDREGWTVLHFAADEGDAGMLQFLLDNGVLHLIDVSDEDRDTPLHIAAWWDRLAVAQMLVERGARVNPKNDKGMTPYQEAQSRSPAVAKYLWSQLSPDEQAAERPPRE
jgi:ankyrin repeat protein